MLVSSTCWQVLGSCLIESLTWATTMPGAAHESSSETGRCRSLRASAVLRLEHPGGSCKPGSAPRVDVDRLARRIKWQIDPGQAHFLPGAVRIADPQFLRCDGAARSVEGGEEPEIARKSAVETEGLRGSEPPP